MNVLVYSGSEVPQDTLQTTLSLLQSVCLPNYTVQPLSKASFIKDPWEIACALFVLPPLTVTSHNGEVEVFGPPEVQKLRAYVEQAGGAFLGLGLGARVEEQTAFGLNASMAGLSLGMEPQGYIQRAPLKFVDKDNKVTVFPILGKETKSGIAVACGTHTVQVSLSDAPLPSVLSTLANESSSSESVVAAHAPIGKGSIALTSAVPASEDDTAIQLLIRSCLAALKLQIPSASIPSTNLTPLPQFLTSAPSNSDTARLRPIVTQLLRPFFDNANASNFLGGKVKDTQDTFEFIAIGSERARATANEDVKRILVCPDGVLPPKEHTPHFDLAVYYEALAKLRGNTEGSNDQWGFGEALLYGERVTSTQSMFDKNPTLLSSLPTPVLSIAAQQLAGRGRGKNVWLSPEGCLMMSLLLRISLDPGQHRPSGALKGGKTTKTEGSEIGKTKKTEESRSGDTKTTKTESTGHSTKTTKTEASSVAPSKTTKTETTPSPSKTTITASDGSTKITTNQLKTSAIGPDSKTATKTTKTTASGTDTAKTSKTSSSNSAGTTKTNSSSSSGQTTGFSQPLLERLASAFAVPPERIYPNPLPHLAASKLVFVQYLFALAVCQACRLPEVLGPELGQRVRIKWPNDLYLDLGEGELKKIGGILVNTNFAPRSKVDVVIGCGLNVLNEPPISSLKQLVSQLDSTTPTPLSLERTAAAIMTTFERLWTEFTSSGGSFDPFLDAYHAVWLHTDQRVTVTTTTPHVKARIVGITSDYGLLRTVRDSSDDAGSGSGGQGWSGGRYVYGARDGGREYIDLQPDGNSFDLMANLIKAKTT